MIDRPDSGLRSKPDNGPGLHRGDRILILVLCLGLAVRYGTIAYPYYTSLEGLFDSADHLVGRDFVVFWTGSVLTLGGQALQIFDFVTFQAAHEQIFGRNFPIHNWPYPPHTLFYVLPLGLVPYLWSYLLWSAATWALYLAAVVEKRRAGVTAVVLLLAPASMANFAFGQNGFLSAALLIGGLRLIDSRPILAGILFGLLSFKPQLGVLIPVALVAGRLWKPFFSAAATVVLLVAASFVVFGPEVWNVYITETSPFQKALLEHRTGLGMFMMPTPFMAARILGAEISTGYLVQAVFTLCAIPCVYLAFRKQTDRKLQIAVLAVATFLVTPYAYNYDMTLVSVAVLWALGHATKTGFLPGEKLLLVAVWILPLAVMPAGYNGLPVAPLVLGGFLAVLLARIYGWAPKPALPRSMPKSVYTEGH